MLCSEPEKADGSINAGEKIRRRFPGCPFLSDLLVRGWPNDRTPGNPLLKGGTMARPLIKKNQSGEPYTRPPGIEAKIDQALGQDVGTLVRRSRVTDSHSRDY